MRGAQRGQHIGAAPYATGGGGTVLEHRYGALLLSSLLTGDPVTELGDDAVPGSVRFQAGDISPVDDLLVTGYTPDGMRRAVSIGVRRAPRLVASEEASGRLFESYLSIVADCWDDLWSGRRRLCLAVASPNAAASQLGELTEIARATVDETGFRAGMARPGRTSRSVRSRLHHIDALVRAAAIARGIGSVDVDASELTWRLLSSLRVRELRLEGSDQADRTFAVSRLRTVVGDGTVAMADRVFSRLAELAGRYAPMAAEVDRSFLLRDLSGTSLRMQRPNTAGEMGQLPSSMVRMTTDKSTPEQVEEIGILPGHVFLSYVREDTARVDRLQGSLEDAGIRVWRDTADLWPGEDWRAKIRRAITDDALVFLACFSHNSLNRKVSYQNEELTLAIEQMRRRRPDDPWLIPVRFDECDIPEWDIGGGRTLASVQRVDLFGNGVSKSFERLVAAILRILGQQTNTAIGNVDKSPAPDADITVQETEKISDASSVDPPIAIGEGDKTEFRSPLHRPPRTLSPNRAAQPSPAVAESPDLLPARGYERIMVNVGEPPVPEAFIGIWLVTPDADESRSREGNDAGAYWGIALTQRGKVAVYMAHVNERWPASLNVYESLDDAEWNHVPRDILAEAAAALGEERPIWRNI